MCAATFRASSFRVRFLRLSAGGCTWFCSLTEGLDACSRNWMISCTGVGSKKTQRERHCFIWWRRDHFSCSKHIQTLFLSNAQVCWPGFDFCRCVSSRVLSRRNSNHEVWRGVLGLLLVTAATRSAASALILPCKQWLSIKEVNLSLGQP